MVAICVECSGLYRPAYTLQGCHSTPREKDCGKKRGDELREKRGCVEKRRDRGRNGRRGGRKDDEGMRLYKEGGMRLYKVWRNEVV
jgi:hypothetical protein